MTVTFKEKWRYQTVAESTTNFMAAEVGQFIHYNNFNYVWDANGLSLPTIFAPTAVVDPGQWLDTVAIPIGAGYATLTVMHHNGFCLWPTATTTNHVGNSGYTGGPSGGNIALDYVNACRVRGIAPGFYISLWDRELEAVAFSGAWDIGNAGQKVIYRARVEDKLTELLGGTYGKISHIWIDGGKWHFGNYYPFDTSGQLYDFIHALQPDCLVLDNNHNYFGGLVSGDIQVFEFAAGTDGPAPANVIPAEFSRPAYQTSDLEPLPAWAHHPTDPSQNVLVDVSGVQDMRTAMLANFCNFHLNSSPNAAGIIPPAAAAFYAAVGTP